MKISVIVCTYNRQSIIIGCLQSIETALIQAGLGEGEIVVVDNASTDDTLNILRQWSASCTVPHNIRYEPHKGLSISRNLAAKAAKGEVLIFTDDDCRFREDYIVNALRHDTADGADLVLRGGRVELGDEGDLALTTKTSPDEKIWSKALNSARHENIGDTLLGCSLMMRKKLFDKIGSFDENIGPGMAIPAGEDTDCYFRAYLADAKIIYSPDMVLYHHHGRKTALQGQNLLKNYILGLGANYAKYIFKHPNLCRSGYWNIKLAIKEIRTGKNLFMPELNYSYKRLVLYMFLGAVLYWKVCLTRLIARYA